MHTPGTDNHRVAKQIDDKSHMAPQYVRHVTCAADVYPDCTNVAQAENAEIIGVTYVRRQFSRDRVNDDHISITVSADGGSAFWPWRSPQNKKRAAFAHLTS